MLSCDSSYYRREEVLDIVQTKYKTFGHMEHVVNIQCLMFEMVYFSLQVLFEVYKKDRIQKVV